MSKNYKVTKHKHNYHMAKEPIDHFIDSIKYNFTDIL